MVNGICTHYCSYDNNMHGHVAYYHYQDPDKNLDSLGLLHIHQCYFFLQRYERIYYYIVTKRIF